MEDKSKVSVLYNAVKCPNKNLYNIKTNKLLFLGAIGKRKGIFDLIETMKILQRKKIDTKLYLYGPDVTEGINDIIKKNNLSDYIEYRGWLDNESKKNIFTHEIALNILPSYNEGLPMTILETMSYGIPNISTNVAAIPEVLNMNNGYINKPGDYKSVAKEIIEFLQDEAKRKMLSNNAYQTILNSFSIENHINKISCVYDEVIK